LSFSHASRIKFSQDATDEVTATATTSDYRKDSTQHFLKA